MTGKTGEKCVSSGKYHCQTHTTNVISMEQGKTFPQCNPPVGGPAHDTTWVKDETTRSECKGTTLSFEAVTVSVGPWYDFVPRSPLPMGLMVAATHRPSSSGKSAQVLPTSHAGR